MPRNNRVIDADLDEELEQDEPSEDELDDEMDHDADTYLTEAEGEEFTDEEVEEMAEERHAKERIAKAKRRGQARDTRRRSTVAQIERAAKEPVRSRPEEWQPANSLEAPPPRQGMEQRWIRFQNGDKLDPRNWSRKTREGWAPRKVDTVPEGFAPPTMKHGSSGEVIGVEDLILCERRLETGRSRARYFAAKTVRQQAAVRRQHVDKVQRDGHGIDVQEKRAQPTVGRGTRRPRVQE